MATDNKNRLTGYLLGDLPEEERDRVEQEFFTEEDLWSDLCAVEGELIEAYVRGGLSEEQKLKFENRFLASPAKRSRIEVARLLIDPALRAEFAGDTGVKAVPPGILPSRRGSAGTVMALSLAAALALAVGLAWVAVQNRQMRSQLADARVMQLEQQRRLDALQRQIDSRPSGEDTSLDAGTLPLISLLLEPDAMRRGGEDQSSRLPVPSRSAEILLAFDLRQDRAARYEVVIRTPEGREIHRTTGLASHATRDGGRAVAVRLPARLLPRGDYLASVFGLDTQGGHQIVDSYGFSVVYSF